MAAPLLERSEPLPGYRLLERLGSGGFGEVWKVEAPGGLHKAIKFVHGQLSTGDDGDLTARQEFKALQRVKDLHHPFILTLERVDVVEGQLVIVMELADRNLWDRYQECRDQGLPGIPREELLRYMMEAAEALDVMNRDCRVQHLDIKPQNLFLIRKHLKVADFGLAKDLEGTHAALTSGITPIYAAPETFEGKVSHYCDQYSLAIVYQELLTGTRPFQGKNARQLLIQHLRAAPDLSSLPAGDQEAVGRALAKDPQQRFETCLEFVQSLPKTGTLPFLPILMPSQGTDGFAPGAPSEAAPSKRPEPSRILPAHDSPTRRDRVHNQKTDPAADVAALKKSSEAVALDKVVRTCQRCGATLKKRVSVGWCPKCGFCPTLEIDGPTTGNAFWSVLAILVGIVAIAAVCLL